MYRKEQTHDLKSDPEIFQEHYDGIKPWDLRPCADRDFCAGDNINYREYDRTTKEYSGRRMLALIIKVRFGPFYCVPEGWAMLYLDPTMVRYDRTGERSASLQCLDELTEDDVSLLEKCKTELHIRIAKERIETETRVLNFLRKFINNHREDGSCPFDSMNEGRCHEYEGCELCVFDHAVKEMHK